MEVSVDDSDLRIQLTRTGMFDLHAADVDGDGARELLLARIDDTRPEENGVVAFEGSLQGGFADTDGVPLLTAEACDHTGMSFLETPDLDGDGAADIALLCRLPAHDRWGVLLAYGPFVDVDVDVDGSEGRAADAMLLASAPDDDLSISLLRAGGDLDGDGFDDLAISCADAQRDHRLGIFRGGPRPQ